MNRLGDAVRLFAEWGTTRRAGAFPIALLAGAAYVSVVRNVYVAKVYVSTQPAAPSTPAS